MSTQHKQTAQAKSFKHLLTGKIITLGNQDTIKRFEQNKNYLPINDLVGWQFKHIVTGNIISVFNTTRANKLLSDKSYYLIRCLH